jgi:DNA repair photolyase
MENKIQKGRGTGTNASGRFEKAKIEREALETWEEEEAPGPRTNFFTDHSKSILTRNDSPDIPFSVSVNPYRGCEHGCVYCYARPTHEYLGLSAGLDFETKIFVKENAPLLLRKELLKPAYTPEVIAFSGITDCYQPAERRYRLTRQCLEVLSEFRNPFTIISKNQLVRRDIDLIAPMAELGCAAVFVTVTSLDSGLAAKLEPRTARPMARLETIRQLSAAGIPVGVMIAPVIPGLTDHEMPKILEACAEAGARMAGFVPLRLPYGVTELFSEWLEAHYPDRKEKVLGRIREIRGGKLNDPNFGSRMQGTGEFAKMMGAMFDRYSKKFALNQRRLALTAEHFRRPGEQLGLF